MDKQREEFYKAFPRHKGILELNDAGTIEYFDALGAVHDFKVWQAAQAAMQSEIDRLASDRDELNDLAEKQEQQLSSANERIAKLEERIKEMQEHAVGKVAGSKSKEK